MPIPALFDRRHGSGAFARLHSMLDNPSLSYQRIGSKLGLSRERISQLAEELGIDGRQREHERVSRREPYIKKEDYPRDILTLIKKLKRSAIHVLPYAVMQRTRPRVGRRSTRMVFLNGTVCSIQVRKGRKLRPRGRRYVRFDVSGETRRAKFAVWAIKNGRSMRLYLIPLTRLRNVSTVYIPADGKYAVGHNIKPRKKWTRYEQAWHLLDSGSRKVHR